MVDIFYDSNFEKKIRKIKEQSTKKQIKKQILKIIENPLIGKPMRYNRKGTRELYIKPYRLSYIYENNLIIFLEIYHKDEQ